MVVVQHHALKAFKTELAILVSIVRSHHSFHFALSDVLPEFRERLVELRSRDFSRAIGVELVEETAEHGLVVDQLGVDGRCEELSVANGVGLIHIQLIENMLDLSFVEGRK